MLLELAPPAVAQLRRLHPVVPEQPADALGDGVRGPGLVYDEHALARTAEHERRAQARGAATDDHGVVWRGTPGVERVERGGHAQLDAAIGAAHSRGGRIRGLAPPVRP